MCWVLVCPFIMTQFVFIFFYYCSDKITIYIKKYHIQASYFVVSNVGDACPEASRPREDRKWAG